MRFSHDVAHALAAEYVLGTLRGRARRRFEALASGDRELARIVRTWEAKLTPLAERIAPVEPPERVWRGIESRIGGAEAQGRGGLWSSLAFWRGFGLIAGGLASVLLAAFLWLTPGRTDTEPVFVAVLTSADSVARIVVSMSAEGELRARTVKPWGGVDEKSLELWVVPKDGAPRSLGLVANRGDTRVRIAPGDARFADAKALAVSLEPRGGSPTGQPTGPVLCSGAIAPTRKA